MSIGTLPPSLPSRHASLPSPFSLLPTPISPRVETSHHVVTSARASAPIVAPSPVTTPDAMMSLTAIEHLDFTPTCDAQTALAACTRPAWALVGHLCHTCRTGRSWICRPCWDDTRTGWACAHCGLVMDARYMLIVAVL